MSSVVECNEQISCLNIVCDKFVNKVFLKKNSCSLPPQNLNKWKWDSHEKVK